MLNDAQNSGIWLDWLPDIQDAFIEYCGTCIIRMLVCMSLSVLIGWLIEDILQAQSTMSGDLRA